MAFAGPEPIMDTLKTSLSARLPARVAAAAALAPAMTLENVAEIALGDRDFLEVYPFLAISVEGPADVLHEKLGRQNVSWPIQLRVFVNDEKPEELERKVWRYVRAIREALVDAETAGEFVDFTWTMNDRQITPSPQRRSEQDQLERDAALVMTCWAAEER